jgi:hypothetical protein
MTEHDRIKADIVATRAELAETADALAARLDVKAQAERRVHEAGERVSSRYAALRDSAPPQVRKALGVAEQVLTRAAADKKATFIAVAGTVVVVVLVQRGGPVAVKAARSRSPRGSRAARRGRATPRRRRLPGAAAPASRRRSTRRK